MSDYQFYQRWEDAPLGGAVMDANGCIGLVQKNSAGILLLYGRFRRGAPAGPFVLLADPRECGYAAAALKRWAGEQ